MFVQDDKFEYGAKVVFFSVFKPIIRHLFFAFSSLFLRFFFAYPSV